MIAVRKKLPPLHDILNLYATIVFLIYGWAIVAFFRKLPSWLYFLSLQEIGAILCYVLVSSLFESMTLLFLFLLAGLIFPSRLFVDKFVLRGTIIICILTFWMALFNLITLIQLPTGEDLISFGLATFLTISLAIFAADRISAVRKMMLALSDRLTVFLYVWLPLSVVGILVLIVRLL